MQSNSSAPTVPPLPTTTSLLHFPPLDRPVLAPYLPNASTSTSTTTSLPHLTLTYATSLDSLISLSPGTPTPLSSPDTKAMTHYLRSMHDGILIGVGTALADDPSLNSRLDGLSSAQQPRPIILDPRARWLAHRDRRVIRTARDGMGKAPWVVVAKGVEYPEERLQVLREVGGAVVEVDVDERGWVLWTDVLRLLGEMGVRSVMVEGGGRVINGLLGVAGQDVVSSVIVTIAPIYLGTGGVVVSPEGRKEVGHDRRVPAVRFRDVVWHPMGRDVVFCGRMVGGDGPDKGGG